MTAARRVRAASTFAVLLAALALATAAAVAFGETALDLGEAFGDAASRERLVLLQLRLPRVMLAAVVGAALAACGSALQALLRNPLADPFVLGVSGGAALGGTLALALGGAALAHSLAVVGESLPGPLGAVAGALLSRSPSTLAALIGAAVATVVVYSAGSVGGRLSTYGALLAGIVFNAFAAGAITLVKALAPPQRVGELLYWLSGSLEYPDWSTVSGALVFELLALGALAARAHDLNLLSLGEEGAASLGVDVRRARRSIFLASSVAVAAAVSVSGLIGFVGLIVPQLLRLAVGPDQRLLLPASALGGALFLVLSDLLARVLFQPLGTATPVGALTALLGAPVFLWLLRRQGLRA